MTTLTCEEAVQALFAYLDRALSGEPLDALEAHLRDCLDCCERSQRDGEMVHAITITARKPAASV